MLIRERFHEVHESAFREVVLPDLTNQTFIRQLFLGTENTSKPNQEVIDFFNRHPSYISNEKRHLGDRNIYSAAATKLITNLKNHLIINFPRFLKRYLYNASLMIKEDAIQTLYKIHGWQPRNEDVPTKEVEETSEEIRYILGLEEGEEITDVWLKDNLNAILRLFVFVNRCLEERDLPLFNILPISKIKAHFITIDTSVFIGILKDIKLAKDIDKDLERDFWYSVFNIKKVVGRGKTFTGTIDTDGVVANIHFQRPKPEKQETQVMNLKGKRVIGVDPGRTNIFQMVEQLEDGSFKEYKLSRNQYYAESGIFIARKRSEHWNMKLKNELNDLSLASPKSTLVENFVVYRDTMIMHKESLWSEYLKKHWRQQRFRLYGGKKRVFSKFLNRLGPLDNTVLAYGSAKFASGGRGEMSVPTSRAFKECSYRVKHVLVDEFRTSKIHWRDNSILHIVKKRNKDGSLSTVRGLLWCNSTNQEGGKFVNRDLNAAVNILRCATLPSRPIILQRSRNQERIVQRLGKIINC